MTDRTPTATRLRTISETLCQGNDYSLSAHLLHKQESNERQRPARRMNRNARIAAPEADRNVSCGSVKRLFEYSQAANGIVIKDSVRRYCDYILFGTVSLGSREHACW